MVVGIGQTSILVTICNDQRKFFLCAPNVINTKNNKESCVKQVT